MTSTSPHRRGRRSHVLFASLAAVLTVLMLGTAPASGFERESNLRGEMTPQLRERIQAKVDEFRTAKSISGVSVAVVTPQRGSSEPVTTMFQSGTISLDEGAAAVTPETQFELGSETKSFTADLLASLLAEGRIRLDDPVSQYTKGSGVWEWRATPTSAAVPITIGQLATHSSGLPDVPYNFNAPCEQNPSPCTDPNPRPYYTQQDLWDSVDPEKRREQVLLWEPGTRWFYSNWGFALLGAILANIVEDTTIDERPLFQPALDAAFLADLGMTRTSLEWPDTEVAVPYLAPTPQEPRNVQTWRWNNTNAFAGGGGLISNATDMSKWVAAHLGYFSADASPGVRALPETLRQVGLVAEECNPVKDPAPGDPAIQCGAPTFQSGLAWQLFPEGANGVGVPYAWKNGGTHGSSSDTVLAASVGVGVTEMFNQSRVDGDSIATAILAEIVPVKRPVPALPATGPDPRTLRMPLLAGAVLVATGIALAVAGRPRRSRAAR